MFDASKRLLDGSLDRRGFIRALTAGGVSLAGARSIAHALDGESAPGATGAAQTAPAAAGPVAGHTGPPLAGRTVSDLTGGELVAEFLLDWDCPYVFGLAGSEEVGFHDAFVDRLGLHYVTCLHENVAMAMADGYSRSTGKTSFVQLHSVAGAAYALGQIVNTFRDRIPVVVTAGRQASDYRGYDGFLEAANLHQLPAEYTQWTWDVMTPESIPETLRRAFLLAEAPPGGPTFVTFSKDFYERPVAQAEILPRTRSRVEYDVAPPEAHVEMIVDRLLAADRPALFVGNEAIRFDPSEDVAAIAEHIAAPVFGSTKAPIVFPNTHPNYVGHFLDDRDLAQEIDAFWSLGGHMFKEALPSDAPRVRRDAAVLHTSLNEREVGRNFPVDAAALASPRATAAAVRQALQARDVETSAIEARRAWLADYSTVRRARFDDDAAATWDQSPISIPRLMSELNAVIGQDADIYTEIVSNDQYLRRYLMFDQTRPAGRRRRNFDTTGGVLGWAVAAAVGGKIGAPDKEVWALSGDGCFNFSVQSLWSAARYEVPIGVVVFNNGEFQANRRAQHGFGRRMAATGKYPGVSLQHPDIDYVALAKGYGVDGEQVEEPGALADALARARNAIVDEGRPYVVDVRIERLYAGADSQWYDFFSVAKNEPRKS